MASHLKNLICVAIVATSMLAATRECQAQPGYYTYDMYGGRFNGATQRPGLFGLAANSPAGYAPAANVAFGTPVNAYAGANPCNTCTAARPVCNPCAAAQPVRQTVGYAPVTTYRWGFTRSAYRPVVSTDACCNKTVAYQPYKTLLPWFKRIPVTSYQPVAQVASQGCNTCSAGVANPVMQSSYAAPTSNCSSCSAGGSTYSPSNGALPQPSLRPTLNDNYYGQPTTTNRIITQPAPSPVVEYQSNPSTRIEAQRPAPHPALKDAEQEKSRLKALPPAEPEADFGAMPETRVPRLFDPNDKSAEYRPTNHFEVAPVVYSARQPVRHTPGGSSPLDDSGWSSER